MYYKFSIITPCYNKEVSIKIKRPKSYNTEFSIIIKRPEPYNTEICIIEKWY